MHLGSAPLRLVDLLSVVEALVPEEDASTERMLMVLTQLRRKGRLVVLDTTPEAFTRMADALGTSTEELVHSFLQAPDDGREAVRRAFRLPEHHGCAHVSTKLSRRHNRHAEALLDAFVTAKWYGWPGLHLEISETMAGICCCGIELTTPAAREERAPRAMSAIDI
jgi:hypothetical protein